MLKYVLFEPYFAAYNQRVERTLGQTELAERFVAETKELEERYSIKAAEENEKFRAVYDKTRSEAAREYDRMVTDARAQAQRKIRAEAQRYASTETHAQPGVQPQRTHCT